MRLKDDILSDPTGDDVTLVDRIARLPDDNAVSALALVARRHGHTVDATRDRRRRPRPRGADPTRSAADHHASHTTVGSGMWLAPPLTHLTADASYRDDIDRALTH
jgi:hypothetical protein